MLDGWWRWCHSMSPQGILWRTRSDRNEFRLIRRWQNTRWWSIMIPIGNRLSTRHFEQVEVPTLLSAKSANDFIRIHHNQSKQKKETHRTFSNRSPENAHVGLVVTMTLHFISIIIIIISKKNEVKKRNVHLKKCQCLFFSGFDNHGWIIAYTNFRIIDRSWSTFTNPEYTCLITLNKS